MTLSKVQPFLDEAFEFLRDREFSVSREDWAKFCASQGMSLEKLKSAKSELLRQSQKLDDDSERLKQIFCCDPFDVANTKSLRDIWHDKAESQADPYQRWYYDISIYLINLSTNSFSQESTPASMTKVSPLPKQSTSKETSKQKTPKNLPSALLNKNKLELKQIISTKRWIFITPIIYCFLLLKTFPPLVITLPIYQLLMIIYFTLCKKNKFLALGISIIISILSFITARIFIADARYVVGDSMLPTIQNEDRVIVDKTRYFFTNYQSKDIVIFKMTGDKISRIIGISGDKIYMKQGIIYVNDIPLERDIDINYPSLEQFTVPTDSYFVLADNLGDNLAHSYWGLVPRSNIIGKVSGRFYPFDRLSLIK
jgi:signal peptidase I